ncbi:MAG: tRNA-dihydrouridine synthase family protein [Candidatus Pacearchaeota archaeon]
MKIPFTNPFILAPLLEPNDIAFRILCKKAGAGGVYTGMTNPLSLKTLLLDDKPILQIFCNSSLGVPKFIKKFDKQVSGWDLNLGCSSSTAKKLKFGSYLTDIEEIENILKIMRENSKKFLSVKIRKSENSFKILKIAEKYCNALIIHPRTREQGYSGRADIEFAIKIKRNSKIPIIYSGDVDEKNAKSLLNIFDFVMIGRKAIGRPCIFSFLLGKECNLNFFNYLALAKKYKLPFSQIKFQAMNFTKSLKNAKMLRKKITLSKNIEEIEKLFYSFKNKF